MQLNFHSKWPTQYPLKTTHSAPNTRKWLGIQGEQKATAEVPSARVEAPTHPREAGTRAGAPHVWRQGHVPLNRPAQMHKWELPRRDGVTTISWSFPKLPNRKNFTSEETEKNNSLKGANATEHTPREKHSCKRHMHTNVHCCTVCKVQDKEATQTPVYRGMGKDVAHVYDGILLGHEKEQDWVVFRDVDGPRDCHTEWSKSERETQISHINIYMWDLEKR